MFIDFSMYLQLVRKIHDSFVDKYTLVVPIDYSLHMGIARAHFESTALGNAPGWTRARYSLSGTTTDGLVISAMP